MAESFAAVLPVSERTEQRVLILLGAFFFLMGVTSTMVNVALPDIGAAFSASEGTYGLVMASYLLTTGGLSAVQGRLGDRHGVRRVYFLGALCFSLFALLSALSPGIWAVIGTRGLQGAGAAAISALGATIVARITPPERRGASIGLLTSVLGVAVCIGPLLGGAVVQAASWRGVFLPAALGLLLTPLFLIAVPPALDEVAPSERAGPPFIDSMDRRFVALVGTIALASASFYGALTLAPIALSQVHGTQPVWIGALLLPQSAAFAVGALASGVWSDRVGPRRVVGFGLAAMSAGALCLALWSADSPAGVAGGMTLVGLGFASAHSPALAAVSRLLPPRHLSTGNGVFMTAVFLGGGLGALVGVSAVEALPEATRWSVAALVLGAPGVLGLVLARRVPGEAG